MREFSLPALYEVPADGNLTDLIRRTGLEIDYRFKLESIDLWETVVINNNKSALARQIAA